MGVYSIPSRAGNGNVAGYTPFGLKIRRRRFGVETVSRICCVKFLVATYGRAVCVSEKLRLLRTKAFYSFRVGCPYRIVIKRFTLGANIALDYPNSVPNSARKYNDHAYI